MKRILIAGLFALAAGGQAFAADLPMPAPVPPQAYVPVVPFYNWTGFYIGINGGGALGNSNWLDPVLGNSGNFTTSGFLIGGTVGANYQVGSFVFGVEGDGDWSNLDGTTANASCAGVGCETRSNWLATVRGRGGVTWRHRSESRRFENGTVLPIETLAESGADMHPAHKPVNDAPAADVKGDTTSEPSPFLEELANHTGEADSALAGRERTLAAYTVATRERYRFYSFGDCMLVL